MKTNFYKGLELIYSTILIKEKKAIQLRVLEVVITPFTKHFIASFFELNASKPKYCVVYCISNYQFSYQSKNHRLLFFYYPFRINLSNNPLSVIGISIVESQKSF